MTIPEILFPSRCLSCQKLTTNSNSFYKYLCPECLKKIKITQDNFCPICHRPTLFGKTCLSCQRKTPLDGLVVSADYQNPILKETIHYFKYRHINVLCLPLAWLMTEKLRDFPWRKKKDWIFIPVPLTKRRLKDRGFNQAELLAKNLSRWLNISTSSAIIKRISFHKPQMEIKDEKKRWQNVKNNFQIKKGNSLAYLKKKKIMLIDDVTTTNATLSECAKVLKPYVKEVWGCVVAK